MPEQNPFSALSERLETEFEALSAENEELRESLEDVRRSLSLEDKGWKLISGVLGGDHDEGLSLTDVQEISKTIRPYVIGGSLVERGANLRKGYVWAKGMYIEGAERPAGMTGSPTSLQRFYTSQVNRASLFGPEAHSELERAAFTDGNVLALCDTALGTTRLFPLSQVAELLTNPDFPDEIWAVRRQWNPDPASGTVRTEWYYTNQFTGVRQKSLPASTQEPVPVGQSKTVVFQRFNRQVGWPMGVPDATAAIPWYEAYSEIMRYGRVVNKALSQMLYKITNPSSKTGASAAKTVGAQRTEGNTVSLGAGQDLQAISTAGKGYDFASARPVASMMAAALDVPIVELLADTSAAGSSYGAAQSLTPPTINAMKFRQDEWIEFYAQIFTVHGLGTHKMWFDPIQEPDFYRTVQGIVLGSSALSDAEYRGLILDHFNIPGNPNAIPPSLAARSEPAQQAASPTQGRNNPAGGGSDNGNDIRTDTLSNALLASQLEDMRMLVERMEAAKAQ